MAVDGRTAASPTIGRIRADSPVPLYFQVRRRLEEYLAEQGVRPGEPIPSESQLQELFGVSRVTVRRAISDLVADAVLVSRRGLGHFVADPSKADAQCLRSFTDDALRNGQRPEARLLAFETVEAEDPAAAELEVARGASLTHVKRIRMLDGKPAYLSDAYVRADVVKGLTRRAFRSQGRGQSLYRILSSVGGVDLVDGCETTSAVAADTEIAAVLGVEPGQPLVLKVCVLRDGRDRPVLYEEAIWGVRLSTGVRIKPVGELGPS
jgi:GntR family transcriptional regulator